MTAHPSPPAGAGVTPPGAPQPPAGNRAVQLAAAVVFAALVIVVVIVLVAGRSTSESTPTPDGTAGLPETTALLDGIEQHGVTLGDPKAPATIIEFIDFQCPFCRDHQLSTQPQVIRDLVRTGKARLAVQPLAFLGPDSELGRAVYLRLAANDHGWEFLNLAFWNQGAENSGYMTPTWLRRVTADIPEVTNADLERLTTSTTRTDAVVRLGVEQAERLKRALMRPGDGTPYVVVGRTADNPTTYRKVDLGSEGSAAESISAAVARLG
ncbi:MAG: thioredoxin domain-containing protein [Solirubrobacteraceae bacterium]|nr:thioredoxin domain-containing protein [Solirubrobacteraceae bacterium]